MNHKYITCTGFGGTGSSVISDLMQEFDNVKSCGSDFEMSIAFDIGGISDLQHYLVDDFERNKVSEGIFMFKKYIRAITSEYTHYLGEDFCTIMSSYLNNLILFEWSGENRMQHFRYGRYERFLYYSFPFKIQNIIRKYFLNDDSYEHTGWFKKKLPMQVTASPDIFFIETRKMFETILDLLDKEYKYEYLCFDQLIPAYNFKRYLNYFPNMKLIIVDRDPRDLFLLNELYWHEAWIPSQNVALFTKWFKEIRRDLEENIRLNKNNVLYIKLEDAIYKYDETISRILSFVGISKDSHISPLTHFVPEKSKRNTCLWKKSDRKRNEILEIEKELDKFCYKY